MVKRPDSFGKDWALFRGNLALIKDAETRRLARLKPVLADLEHRIPSNPALIFPALRLLRRGAAKGQTRVLLHPAFSLWISIAQTMIGQKLGVKHPGWSALGSHLQEFAISQAMLLGAPFETALLSDHLGHIHLQGLSCYLDLGLARVFKPVIATHRAGWLTAAVLGEKGGLRIPTKALLKGMRAEGLVWLPRIGGALEMDSCNPLVLNQNKITDHKIGLENKERFIEKLRKALAQMRRLHPEAHDEILRLIRLIVPLQTPKGMTSASSTSREFPGALMLSHCEDTLVQAETLVHEGSHAKLNLFLEKEALFTEPGEILYYSPLKEFPRPVHYLLFAAHSFINVVDYLLRFLKSGGRLSEKRRQDLELYTARRAYEAELELLACGSHAKFTEAGRLFYLACLEALGRQMEAISAFNPDNIRQARSTVDRHRLRFSHYPGFLFKEERNARIPA